MQRPPANGKKIARWESPEAEFGVLIERAGRIGAVVRVIRVGWLEQYKMRTEGFIYP